MKRILLLTTMMLCAFSPAVIAEDKTRVTFAVH